MTPLYRKLKPDEYDWNNLDHIKATHAKTNNTIYLAPITPDEIPEVQELETALGVRNDEVTGLTGQLAEARAACTAKDEALHEVEAHQTRDGDDNFVCWIGESTFEKVKAALAIKCN